MTIHQKHSKWSLLPNDRCLRIYKYNKNSVHVSKLSSCFKPQNRIMWKRLKSNTAYVGVYGELAIGDLKLEN